MKKLTQSINSVKTNPKKFVANLLIASPTVGAIAYSLFKHFYVVALIAVFASCSQSEETLRTMELKNMEVVVSSSSMTANLFGSCILSHPEKGEIKYDLDQKSKTFEFYTSLNPGKGLSIATTYHNEIKVYSEGELIESGSFVNIDYEDL